jgi:hypothetical protein
MNEMNELRMKYAGLLGLLQECSVYVPEDTRESIEQAFTDAEKYSFKWKRILNRIEII